MEDKYCISTSDWRIAELTKRELDYVACKVETLANGKECNQEAYVYARNLKSRTMALANCLPLPKAPGLSSTCLGSFQAIAPESLPAPYFSKPV